MDFEKRKLSINFVCISIHDFMNDNIAIIRQIAIVMAPQLNNRLQLPLLERCGGIDGFFEEKDTTIEALFREAGKTYLPLERKEWLLKAKEEWEVMQKEGIHCCTWEDHHYPHLLQHCEDAPLVLFYKGNLPAAEENTLAVVGTRKATERGKNRVDSLIKGFVEKGLTPSIISGLAYGIDVAAHNACLRYGLKTYAVLGHGLNMIYPAPHKNTAEKIVAQGGGLISEFPCCAKVLPINFLQRNRIVAGMSAATLVAESPVKGGAMATARQALSYYREVMAIPGRPEDVVSGGCNALIKQNVAALVEQVDDICHLMHWEPVAPPQPHQTSIDFFPEDKGKTRIQQLLSEQGELHIDQLQLQSGLPAAELASLLLAMELEGIIMQLPGKIYSLL